MVKVRVRVMEYHSWYVSVCFDLGLRLWRLPRLEALTGSLNFRIPAAGTVYTMWYEILGLYI